MSESQLSVAATRQPIVDAADPRLSALMVVPELKTHILDLRDINKVFVNDALVTKALDRISFAVERGEFVSIIGPSGCGKSTLFKIIGGLDQDYNGEVRIEGKVTTGYHPSIGMVFQEESTFPWRTVAENVAFPLEIAGMSKADRFNVAREFIQLVGLQGYEDRYPSQLSGGMRQRVAIARTLTRKPHLLLMDEPFAALDEQTRRLLGEKVLQIQQELKQTTILITHSISEAVQLSDRIIVMTFRPGRSKRIVSINLPRPRSADVVGSEQFARYVADIWADIREEATRGMDYGSTRANGET